MNLISIIIPTYNRGSLLGETINSVLSQTYKKWELIIIDDGSTDGTKEVVKPFLADVRIKYLKRPEDRPRGGNAARNYGFEMSNGVFIKWLDSDDLLAPECLENQLRVLLSDNTDTVFCRSRFFTQNIISKKNTLGRYWHKKFIVEGNHLENFIFGNIRFSNNDGLWRASCLKVNPYHETLRNSQEYLMIAKALASGISISLLDEELVWIREHDSRMGSSRTYAVFAKHQRLARYLIIKELKANNIKNPSIYKYLNKSIIYYLYKQIKRGDYSTVFSGMDIAIKAMTISYLK